MSGLSNIERISEEMFANYHQMQHFITESNWGYRPLMDQVSNDVGNSLPKRKLTGLIIDESGWEKKGEKSVGVGPQYCGNAGKTCNSQVAVLGTLSNGDFASMVGARLFLPESWCDDQSRCKEAGIPEQDRIFKTKWEIAIDIVKHQKGLGANFDYVGGDGYYGNSIELAESIEGLGLVYMLDIHSNLTVYLEKCGIGIPPYSGKGRKPTKEKPLSEGFRADKYIAGLTSKDWQRIAARNTTKGKLVVDYNFRTVYVWDKDNNLMLRRLLAIRRSKTPKGDYEYKYSFTNANLEQYTEKGIADNADDNLFIRADFSLVKIPLDDILYIEGLADYLKIHIKDRKTIVARMTMKEMVEKLNSTDFIRVHRSYILPFKKIEAVKGTTIFMGDNEFPIGRTYAEYFFNRYSE